MVVDQDIMVAEVVVNVLILTMVVVEVVHHITDTQQ